MKSFDILHNLQVLSLLLYGTGSTHLPSILNTDVINECRSIMNRENDNPHLAMNYYPTNVHEGQSVTLCCCSKSQTKFIEMWWGMNSLVLTAKDDTNVLCHKIKNVSRNDSGVYRCFVDTKTAILNNDVRIEVSYPPYIPDNYLTVTEKDISRTLQCLAQGMPVNYTYGQLKHLSFFGDHIRYLNSDVDGRVTLPHIANTINRYQDSGIYICNVSNGVIDNTGSRFQNGKIFVIANGPPVFMEKIENKQYGELGNIFNLKCIVYTKSEIDLFNVKSDNTDIASSMKVTSVNSTTIFHGTDITVEASQVVLSFKISNNNNSQIYTVTICNGYGNNSFEVEIETVTTEENITYGIKVAIIIIFVMLVSGVPVLVAAVFLKRKKNSNRERRIVDDIPELVEGQPAPVENIVYQDAIVFRSIPLQANGEFIEYNYETYSHEQNMRPLTGQLNYSDVYFQPSTSQDVQIRGIENRTVYSEVINSERGSSVIDSQSVSSTASSDEEDFIDIEGLENFIDRSED